MEGFFTDSVFMRLRTAPHISKLLTIDSRLLLLLLLLLDLLLRLLNAETTESLGLGGGSARFLFREVITMERSLSGDTRAAPGKENGSSSKCNSTIESKGGVDMDISGKEIKSDSN